MVCRERWRRASIKRVFQLIINAVLFRELVEKWGMILNIILMYSKNKRSKL